MMQKNLDKEYAGITGLPAFTKSAGELAYGEDSPLIKENRVNLIYIYIVKYLQYDSLPLLNLSLVLVLFVWALNS